MPSIEYDKISLIDESNMQKYHDNVKLYDDSSERSLFSYYKNVLLKNPKQEITNKEKKQLLYQNSKKLLKEFYRGDLVMWYSLNNNMKKTKNVGIISDIYRCPPSFIAGLYHDIAAEIYFCRENGVRFLYLGFLYSINTNTNEPTKKNYVNELKLIGNNNKKKNSLFYQEWKNFFK